MIQRLEEDQCRPRGGGQQQRLPQQCSQRRRHNGGRHLGGDQVVELKLALLPNESLVTLTTGLQAAHAANEFVDALRTLQLDDYNIDGAMWTELMDAAKGTSTVSWTSWQPRSPNC